LNLTRTIGVTIFWYEINFIITSKSGALEKPLIVMDQLWHLVRCTAKIAASQTILMAMRIRGYGAEYIG